MLSDAASLRSRSRCRVGVAQAQKLTIPLTSLQTGAALTAAQAALARCDKDGYTAAVAVVDRGGHALALLRNRLAGAHTVPTAIDKASTALSLPHRHDRARARDAAGAAASRASASCRASSRSAAA